MTRPAPSQTVLVVEDEPELRDVLCHILTDGPIVAVPARDGRQAIEWLRREPTPSVIVLDLMLPEIDGLGVLDWLRVEPRLAGVPVVVVSAAARARVALALEHGPALFLPKPIDAVRLVRSVRRACGLDPDAHPLRDAA